MPRAAGHTAPRRRGVPTACARSAAAAAPRRSTPAGAVHTVVAIEASWVADAGERRAQHLNDTTAWLTAITSARSTVSGSVGDCPKSATSRRRSTSVDHGSSCERSSVACAHATRTQRGRNADAATTTNSIQSFNGPLSETTAVYYQCTQIDIGHVGHRSRHDRQPRIPRTTLLVPCLSRCWYTAAHSPAVAGAEHGPAMPASQILWHASGATKY